MNKTIRRASVFTLLLVFSLLIRATWVQFYEGRALADDKDNRRNAIETYAEPLGNIVVAGERDHRLRADEGSDLTYKRTYKNGRLYAAVTGYASQAYAPTQLEGIYADLLNGTDLRLKTVTDTVTDKRAEPGNVVTTSTRPCRRRRTRRSATRRAPRSPSTRRRPDPRRRVDPVVRPDVADRRRHRRRGWTTAERGPGQAADQPGAAPAAAAGLDVQAGGGGRRAGGRAVRLGGRADRQPRPPTADRCGRSSPMRSTQLGGLDIYVHNTSGKPGKTIEAWQNNMDIDLMSLIHAADAALRGARRACGRRADQHQHVGGRRALRQRLEQLHGASRRRSRTGRSGRRRCSAPRASAATSCRPARSGSRAATGTASRTAAPEFFEATEKTHPMGKLGDVQDVANAVVFLASPAAKHINGANLTVDGGYHEARRLLTHDATQRHRAGGSTSSSSSAACGTTSTSPGASCWSCSPSTRSSASVPGRLRGHDVARARRPHPRQNPGHLHVRRPPVPARAAGHPRLGRDTAGAWSPCTARTRRWI